MLGFKKPSDRKRFYHSAAPEAIAAYLKAERAKLARQADEVTWLEGLYARRCQQIAAGEWPPPKDAP